MEKCRLGENKPVPSGKGRAVEEVLGNYLNLRNRVDFIPPGVVGVLHPASADSDAAADWRDNYGTPVVHAGGFGIGLADRELADNLKHQISPFIAHIACVEVVLLPRIELNPPMRVTIRLVPQPVLSGIVGGVHNRSGYAYAHPMDDKPLGVINMTPQRIVARRSEPRKKQEN
jgi:hypothetical protein